MRKHEEEEHDNSERWLLSYADFITLLMVFFIIMYSMSKVDQVKFYQLAQSLSSAFIGGTGTLEAGDKNTGVVDPNNLDLSEVEKLAEQLAAEKLAEQAATEQAAQQQEMENMQQLSDTLAKYFVEKNINDEVTLNIDDRGLVISLTATALFDSGSADVKEEMAKILIDSGEIINSLENYIRVEGHTDNVPVGVSKYKTNWELSTARATNVVELFVEQVGIDPQKLVAAGYSEYKPITTNDTAEGRSKNRRVDIIILNSKYNALESERTDSSSVGQTPEEIVAEVAP